MNKKILGYYADGKPIHEVSKGYIATAAFIFCEQCRIPISSLGGPAYGSLCIPCYNAKQKEENNVD